MQNSFPVQKNYNSHLCLLLFNTTVTVTRDGEKIKFSDTVHNLNHTCIFIPYQERCTFS